MKELERKIRRTGASPWPLMKEQIRFSTQTRRNVKTTETYSRSVAVIVQAGLGCQRRWPMSVVSVIRFAWKTTHVAYVRAFVIFALPVCELLQVRKEVLSCRAVEKPWSCSITSVSWGCSQVNVLPSSWIVMKVGGKGEISGPCEKLHFLCGGLAGNRVNMECFVE